MATSGATSAAMGDSATTGLALMRQALSVTRDVVAITLQAHHGRWGCQPPPQGRNTGKEIAEESDGGTVGRCTMGEGRLDYLQEVLEKERRRAGTSRRRPKDGRRGARGHTLLPTLPQQQRLSRHCTVRAVTRASACLCVRTACC